MKKVLLGCAAFIIFCARAANAADLPAKAPIYKATPAYSWSGLYGGISGGYAWGENKITEGIVNGGAVNKYEPSGGFGGVQIGYNNQFAPHWLIGGEVDISGGKIDDNLLASVGTPGKDEFNAFGTARTRFGYVQDRWFVYGTAGAIWLRDRSKTTVAGATLTDNMEYHVGWVFGGGLEYAVDNRWSWKLEYLYAPLDRSHDNKGILSRQTDASFSIVRVGLNYRFGDGIAPASYMPAKAAAPRSSWAGSYLGLHGGYGWGKVHEVFTAIGTASFEPDGGYGGFQGGYNWLFAPNALLGVEVDSSFGDLKDDGAFSGGNAGTAKIDDLGTARLRLGYLMTPDTLLYVTGGAAYAREKSTAAAPTGFNTKVDHLGWTIGGGVEYKFAPEWSVKAEYLYADLGDFKANIPLVVAQTRTSDMTLNTVRVGLNYSGPVIERFFGGR